MAGSKESTTFLGVDRKDVRKWGAYLTVGGFLASFVTALAIPFLALGIGTLVIERTAGKKK